MSVDISVTFSKHDDSSDLEIYNILEELPDKRTIHAMQTYNIGQCTWENITDNDRTHRNTHNHTKTITNTLTSHMH